jgi:hypothetical protein
MKDHKRVHTVNRQNAELAGQEMLGKVEKGMDGDQ